MARIISGEMTGEEEGVGGGRPKGGKRLSFKTRKGGRPTVVRSLPSSKVQEIASHFNGALLAASVAIQNDNSEPETVAGGIVREAVRRLETLAETKTKKNETRTKIAIKRRNSSKRGSAAVLQDVIKLDPPPPAGTPAMASRSPCRLSVPKVDLLQSLLDEVKPNNSFLHQNSKGPLEEPVVRLTDKKGYGRINTATLPPLQANSSSLHRHLAVQIQTKYEDVKTETEPESEPYELVENSYDVIGNSDSTDEAIYDDVLNVVNPSNEGIYEVIYEPGTAESFASQDHQNSIYGLRPPSEASSVHESASRSDTSDDWIDIVELQEEIQTKRSRQPSVIEDKPKPKNCGGSWSKQWGLWSHRTSSVAVTSSSLILIGASNEPQLAAQDVPQLSTKGLVNLRTVLFGPQHEAQEITLHLPPEVDSNSKRPDYERIDREVNGVFDDFDGSSDSETEIENVNVANHQQTDATKDTGDGIYKFMITAGKKVKKTSRSISQKFRRMSLGQIQPPTLSAAHSNGSSDSVATARGRWPSLKKKRRPLTTSTFYLDQDPPANPQVPVDPRRLSTAIRPTSPPPPPPAQPANDKQKAINDSILYIESGVFDRTNGLNNNSNAAERLRNSTNNYYDAGLYQNGTFSDHESSQGSELDLRFSDEPLYQFYAATVAELERNDSDIYYEEIRTTSQERIINPRPSALDLVSPEARHRTLWCQVPQVVNSGVLDTLSPTRKKLQEAKFELLTSEASYYKSLTLLEKHFASSPELKRDEILSKVDYKTLFGNLAPVRKCSEAVLGALEKCWQESILLEGVCEVVLNVAKNKFSTYIKFCEHQAGIERTLKLLKKNTQFCEVLTKLESSPDCHSLSLSSFLLLPIQRVTRVPLLLDAIMTRLEPNDPEIESCRTALTFLNDIVYKCNEAARKTERLEELARLQTTLVYPKHLRPLPLVSASRWLIRSGQVTQVNPDTKSTLSKKLTAPRSIKLTLFLLSDYLLITKKKGEDSYTVVTYCPRNLVQITKMEDPLLNRFLVILTLIENHEGKTQEMMVSCGSESSRERWLQPFAPVESSNPDETLYETWDCPQVSAIHPYPAGQPDELALQHGDVINVLTKMADGWYYGEKLRNGEKGWFPGNHTVEIASAHVRARNLRQRHRLLALTSSFISQQATLNKC